MIDSKAAITMIPKAVANEMNLYITICIDGFIPLDSSFQEIMIENLLLNWEGTYL